MKRILNQRIIFSLFALLTIFLEIAAAPGLNDLQSGGWSTPTSISSSQATGWFPDIVSDSMGQVHVVWAAGTTGFDTVLYTSTTDGIHWLKPNDIAAVPYSGIDSFATRPAIWVDNTGFLNLSYASGSIYFSQAPIISAGSASAWSQSLKLSGNQVAYHSSVLQDTHNQIHLFFTENVISNTCNQCYHLFHRVSTDHGSTWSDPQDISADGTGAVKPQVIEDEKGDIFVVWESGIGGGTGQLGGPSVVKFAASYDFGQTWTQSTVLSPSTFTEAKNITIGMDGQGNLITAWLGLPDNIIYYQKSFNGGRDWSRPFPINNVHGAWDIYSSKLDDYSMVTDSSGAIHLIFIGQVDGKGTSTENLVKPSQTLTPTLINSTQTPPSDPLYVLNMTWQGNVWSEPEVVAKYTGDVPEWPRVAISGGNVLNVVWFLRDQADIWISDNAHYHVWYARKQLDIPAMATEIPTFSLTPTPVNNIDLTQTVTQVAAGNDPLPTLAPNEKIQTQATYSESDYLTIFAKSMAPTAVVIFVIGLIVFIFKRYR